MNQQELRKNFKEPTGKALEEDIVMIYLLSENDTSLSVIETKYLENPELYMYMYDKSEFSKREFIEALPFSMARAFTRTASVYLTEKYLKNSEDIIEEALVKPIPKLNSLLKRGVPTREDLRETIYSIMQGYEKRKRQNREVEGDGYISLAIALNYLQKRNKISAFALQGMEDIFNGLEGYKKSILTKLEKESEALVVHPSNELFADVLLSMYSLPTSGEHKLSRIEKLLERAMVGDIKPLNRKMQAKLLFFVELYTKALQEAEEYELGNLNTKVTNLSVLERKGLQESVKERHRTLQDNLAKMYTDIMEHKDVQTIHKNILSTDDITKRLMSVKGGEPTLDDLRSIQRIHSIVRNDIKYKHNYLGAVDIDMAGFRVSMFDSLHVGVETVKLACINALKHVIYGNITYKEIPQQMLVFLNLNVFVHEHQEARNFVLKNNLAEILRHVSEKEKELEKRLKENEKVSLLAVKKEQKTSAILDKANARIRELEAQLKAEQGKVKGVENNKKEVEALRNYVYNTDKEVEVVYDKEQSFEEKVAKLKETEIYVVGGHPKWVQTVKQTLPNINFIVPEAQNASYTQLKKGNYILLLNTSVLNHSIVRKIMPMVEKTNAKMDYVNNSINIELFVNKVYEIAMS